MSTRDRVEKAAEHIIRRAGVKGLTMRQLAEEADVALRTPYNLYGSKTAVLLALLDRTTRALVEKLASDNSDLKLTQLFNALDTLEQFYSADEDYFRTIFWAVMTSDHPDERAAAHANIVDIVTLKVIEAHAAQELKASSSPRDLGEQLGLNLLANLGSWAGGHLSMASTAAHTKAVWLALIAPVATRQSAQALKALSEP